MRNGYTTVVPHRTAPLTEQEQKLANIVRAATIDHPGATIVIDRDVPVTAGGPEAELADLVSVQYPGGSPEFYGLETKDGAL